MNTRNKIMIVDDDPVTLDFFQLMLSKLGFSVEKATDGLDALEKVEDFRPDLILLDNIMPRMSGWDLTKKLKGDDRFWDIPIIMFSALDDVKDKVAGFELGVDDYITKPFNFSEVLARIKAILRTRELFAQIAVRESRLGLAEELSSDMRQTLSGVAKGMDDLAALAESRDGAGRDIMAKVMEVRGLVKELDSRIGKTVSEWEDLKKNEIGLSTLESESRKFLQQEQR